MSLLQIDAAGFNEAIKSESPVLVKLFATWCGPCKMLTPVVEKVADEIKGVAFVELDIDKSPEIPTQLHISGVPTIIMFKNGTELGRLVGYNNEEAVKEFVTKYS